ncbi:hypothetical protein [Rhodococcus sp. NPDC003348]
MAGTSPRKAAPRRVLTEQNPTGATPGAIELSDEFGTENPEPPQPITLFGEPYSVRRDLTGEEVLEFSRMLRQTPKLVPATTEDGTPIEGGKPTVDIDDWNRLMVERLAFVLSEGDPVRLWEDIGAQNVGVGDKLVQRIYSFAGLLDAEGNFRAL